MATPMSNLGLPALMDPNNSALNISEPKKFDTVILSIDDKADELNVEANNDVGEGQNQAIPKPPKYESAQFHENLQKGISIECGKHSVFGFGLSGDQEDALFQYISKKSSNQPSGYEPNRPALVDCWESPEPEREDQRNSDLEGIPVIFSTNVSQILPTKELIEVSKSGGENFEPRVKARPPVLVVYEEKDYSKDQDKVDIASTESLYEGEGGLDLQSRCAAAVDVAKDAEELADRLLIMQKVKECYGLGVKTSLERVMRKGPDLKPIIASQELRNPTTLIKSKLKEEVVSPIIKEANNVDNSLSTETAKDESFSNLWEDECMKYLERAPEFRARLHYEVRVILISPAFHVVGHTVTAFARLYEKKFGRTIDSVGFSTAARLCRSMPHVVQRALLIDEGKLQLVDTLKNHRIVAGIRSGLRRIVYCIIKSHQGVDIEVIEGLLNRVIQQPLHQVLNDHGYQTPSIECLLRDMPDIVYLEERLECTQVYLCNGAEDPALTDGLLIQGPSLEEFFEDISKDKSKFNRSKSICYSKLLKRGKLQSLNDDVDEQLMKSPECLQSGSSGMAPEELLDLRVLCAAESSSPYIDASIYTIEDISPHVRLRFRLLLALHNNGHGVKVEELPIVYEKMFAASLDLSILGFDSLQELIDTWKDVILVKASSDGLIFPINTLENNRVLNTITSGLRSTIFAILLARYPEGLEPQELVECLEETLSGRLWEILKSNGYFFKSMNKAEETLSKGLLDFQLAECSELRLLLKDMEDFVRLGCKEDGELIVKLRDGEFPLLDLLDCEVCEEAIDNKDEQSSDSSNSDAFTKNILLSQKTKKNRGISMAMDIQIPTIIKNRSLTIEHEELDKIIKNEGLTPLITNSFEQKNLASPLASPLSISNVQIDTPKQVCYPSQKLIHEIRMIFGSSKYMENGLTMEEFCTIYKERVGHPLHLGEFKSMESLLHAMPQIVSFEISSICDEQMITLVQSRRNMRILSVTKAGLRQVLFWILLKNPGGVWKELLEGWYLDFAGWPLSSALASHGYDKPRCAPLEPVMEFLQDMADLLTINEDDSNLYIWVGLYKDPIIEDALLLGIPIETIQYDSTIEENENSRHWHTSVIASAAFQSKNKELENKCNIKRINYKLIDNSIEKHKN